MRLVVGAEIRLRNVQVANFIRKMGENYGRSVLQETRERKLL